MINSVKSSFADISTPSQLNLLILWTGNSVNTSFIIFSEISGILQTVYYKNQFTKVASFSLINSRLLDNEIVEYIGLDTSDFCDLQLLAD